MATPMHRGTLLAWGWILGMGCNSIAGFEPGEPRDAFYCTTSDDCEAYVTEPQCRSVAGCVEGRCAFNDIKEFTPLGDERQTDGDCRVVVCNGAGTAKIDQDAMDVQDDGNPCTLDECKGFTAHAPLESTACYTGPPKTLGKGLCAVGAQKCDNGTPVGGCEGDVVPAPERCDGTPNDEDCDDNMNEEGAGCVCVPGTARVCDYTGPTGTEGVGNCHAGQQVCNASGLDYGLCVGEQLPQPEVCSPPGNDEDCNGFVDEIFDCYCGNGTVDAPLGEVCDDGNDIPFDACTSACKPAACGDAIVSSTESCDDGNTQDGDGCPANCQHPILRIETGWHHTCAVLRNAGVKCWGRNDSGELGLGDMSARGDQPGEMGGALPTVDLGIGLNAVAMSAADQHSCALFEQGEVKCWGRNHDGQLGVGDLLSRGDAPGEMGDSLPSVNLGVDRKAVAIAAYGAHSCALLQDGTIKCWGNNAAGELGLGDQEARGDHPDEMGDALPSVNLGAGKKAVAIAAGDAYNCALLHDGSVKCWGDNFRGALGLGDAFNRGDDPGEMGDALPSVDLGTGKKAVGIATTFWYTCALLDGGSVKCWGNNTFGQLGLGDTQHRGDDPGEMGDALPSVDFGTGKKAVVIATGDSHTCALLDDGSVKCWGSNFYGALGLGDTQHRGDDPGEMGDALPTVDLGIGRKGVTITNGVGYTCTLIDDGTTKCWGSNDGRLGLGDVQDRGDNPGEMGDVLPVVSLF